MEVGGIDTRSGIRDLDDGMAVCGEGPDANERTGRAMHCVAGIQHQVQDDLLELALVALHGGQIGR